MANSDSLIQKYLANADLYDSFSTEVAYSNQTAFDIYSQVTSQLPDWFNYLMKLRNQIVSRLGLKNLGKMTDFDSTLDPKSYQKGDRIGIFTVYEHTEHELLLGDSDKHLDVKVSFKIEPRGDRAVVRASTVVHVKNALGKVYLLFVTPVHKLIVPVSLRGLSHAPVIQHA